MLFTTLALRTEVIGQGAFGIVYRGRKEDTGAIVAIKLIPFADSTPEGGVPCNVIREISLLRELDHPNVVCVRCLMLADSEVAIVLVVLILQSSSLMLTSCCQSTR